MENAWGSAILPAYPPRGARFRIEIARDVAKKLIESEG